MSARVSESGSQSAVADIWAMPTEALGSAKEAHRRWPEGRSEQASCSESDTARRGASKVKDCGTAVKDTAGFPPENDEVLGALDDSDFC